jgi:hypothetical protein
MQPGDVMRDRIRELLAVPGIGKLIAAYFDPGGPFAGTTFDLLGDNPPGELRRDDLLATTLLDISWRPPAVRALLADSGPIAAELAAIPADLDLWLADDAILQAATALHKRLDKLDGVGPVIASKLLARKRPRLVPIHDRHVLRVLTPPANQFWVTLGDALREPSLRAEIEELRPAGAESLSLLRLLDAAVWMRHSRSRTARKARLEACLPEPGA